MTATGSSKALCVVVAETAPILREGIIHCLQKIDSPALRVIRALDYSDLIEGVTAMQADIVIANPTFCGAFDPAALRKRSKPALRIAALATTVPDRRVADLYDAVIAVTDTTDNIAATISSLTDGDTAAPQASGPLLSDREKDVVRLVVRGLTNKEIADRLFISPHTVVTHRRNIARKLEIHSATGLTIYAIVNGLVDLSEIDI